MGVPGLFFHVRIWPLLRGRIERPEGSILDPISAPGAARERPGSQNGDIELSMVFTGSGAPRRLRCRPGMAPGSALEGALVLGSPRGQKSDPDGLRKCSPMGPKSFDKTSIWAPEGSRARDGRHRLNPHIYKLRRTSGSSKAGLKTACKRKRLH